MKNIFLSKVQFDQWVRDMISSYNNRGSVFKNVRRLTLDDAGKNTIIMNLKTGKTAIAKYDGTAKYSPEIGLAVAWAKYKHLRIPIVAKKTSTKNLKFLDTFYLNKFDITKYTYIGQFENDFDMFIARDESGNLVTMSHYILPKVYSSGEVEIYKEEKYRL